MKKLTLLALWLFACNIYAKYYVNLGIGTGYSGSGSSYAKDSSSVTYSPTSIGTSVFTLPAVTWYNKYRNGGNASVAYGYKNSVGISYDLEFLYQLFGRETSGSYNWREQYTNGTIYSENSGNPITSMYSHLNVFALMANANYDFKYRRKFSPMLGMGLGVAYLTASSASANATLNIDDPMTVIFENAPVLQTAPSINGITAALQLKAAMRWRFKKYNTIVLYRFFVTTKLNASQTTIISNPNNPSQTATFYIPGHRVGSPILNTLEVIFQFPQGEKLFNK